MAGPNEPKRAPSACLPPDVKWCGRTPGAPRDGARGAGRRAARDATTTAQEEQWRRSRGERGEGLATKREGRGRALRWRSELPFGPPRLSGALLSPLSSLLSLLTGLTLEGRRASIYGHICTQFIRASPSSKNHILYTHGFQILIYILSHYQGQKKHGFVLDTSDDQNATYVFASKGSHGMYLNSNALIASRHSIDSKVHLKYSQFSIGSLLTYR
jgi:hypothetical protein